MNGQIGKELVKNGKGIMTENKRFKEVIFTWINSGGEYHYERRIVIKERQINLTFATSLSRSGRTAQFNNLQTTLVN